MGPGGEGARRKRGRRRRLSRSAEFERVYRDGRSHASRHLVVYAFPRADAGEEPRLGVSVGRKIGGAVERNRMKRLLREAFWSHVDQVPRAYDFVLVARPEAARLAEEQGEAGMAAALAALLRDAGLADEPDAGEGG